MFVNTQLQAGKRPARRAALILLGVCVSATAICAQSDKGNAGSNSAQNVNVVNTPTVNIGSMPAVTVSGTPTVTIGSATVPLQVQEISAKQPFHWFQQGMQIASGNNFLSVSVPVPSGKRLVIEQASAHATINNGPGESLRLLLSATGGGTIAYSWNPLSDVGRNDLVNEEFMGTVNLHMFADPSTNYTISVTRSADSSGFFTGTVAAIQLSVTGYLIDVP